MVLSHNFPDKTEENHKNLSQDSQPPYQNLTLWILSKNHEC